MVQGPTKELRICSQKELRKDPSGIRRRDPSAIRGRAPRNLSAPESKRMINKSINPKKYSEQIFQINIQKLDHWILVV